MFTELWQNCGVGSKCQRSVGCCCSHQLQRKWSTTLGTSASWLLCMCDYWIRCLRNFMTDSHSYDVWRAVIPLVEKRCSLCINWKKNSSISDRYYLLYVIYQLILGSHFGMGFFDFCVLFYQLFTLSWPLQHLSSLTWLYPIVLLLLLKMNSMKVALSHCCCSTTIQCHRVVLNKRKWFF